MNQDSLRQLIANCRHKCKRYLGFPRDWSPHQVRNPTFKGFYFTDAGAWELIADRLEGGHPYEEIILDNPKGALAIVLKIQLAVGEQHVYIKVQVGAGNKAIGRSFHYSDHY